MLTYMRIKGFIFFILTLLTVNIVIGQHIIDGTVYDIRTNETLIGANIFIPQLKKGTVTDIDGNFSIEVNSLPISLEASFIGFDKKIIVVSQTKNPLRIDLNENKEVLSEVTIIENRLTEKQQQSAVTIEAMDIIAIKETPAASFYEGLGNLKGVDITSASLGFKIINTRGFNSTSPVRSLQIIDGVDNQSPGLNFSLGNFLGSSELDLKKVEIIVGANSALYGPNAFNGVISMETKSPFQFPGFSFQQKYGDRNLNELSFRWAEVIKNKKGENLFGIKYNFYRMTANDWEADNYDAAYETYSSTDNPGGYDAVNVYGDEYNKTYGDIKTFPGLRTFHRQGYKESDLVDYNTKNFKANAALHAMLSPDIELVGSVNYGSGTTVYQGDNRYNLKGLQFFQNKLELSQKDKFFIRYYSTWEDAGETYDAVATAQALMDKSLSNIDWADEYSNLWRTDIYPQILDLPGWVDVNTIDILSPGVYEQWKEDMNQILNQNEALLQDFHQFVQDSVNLIVGQQGSSMLIPGTPEFDQAFNEITSQTRYDEEGNLVGGTKFYDKSKLRHLHAEYKFDVGVTKFVAGANARIYMPDSDGSIFDDGFTTIYQENYLFDQQGLPVILNDTVILDELTSQGIISDTTITSTHQFYIDTLIKDIVIRNKEFGVYVGFDRNFDNETIKVSATLRMDKNENFDYLFSPAASIVYTPTEKDVIRVSLSSAIRNPTLTDQYLNYDVGQAILLGNLNGFGYDQYFVNVDSLEQYFIGNTYNPSALLGGFIKVDPIRPEKVKTVEFGYRTTLFEKLYLDASVYFSEYDDFIGYQTGASFKFGDTKTATQQDVNDGWANEVGETIDDYYSMLLPSIQGYRVAANAQDKVTTQGFSIGLNYFVNKYITLNGNYSWNKLNKKGTNDPIIPAFNTPEHKFNIGISSRDLSLYNSNYWGFSMNYKWIDTYTFEGSPQFTGVIPTYHQIDAQINKQIPELKATFKIGASNLLNNKTYQVYGGPRVGRMLHTSLLFEL